MSTIRIKKEERFTQIFNETISNTNVSDEAYRLLSYLLTKPNDWTLFNNEVIHNLQKTEHWLDKALKNLKENGYMTREKKHVNGRWEWETVIYEIPEKRSNNENRNNETKTIEGNTIGCNTTGCNSTDCNTTGCNSIPCKTPDILILENTNTKLSNNNNNNNSLYSEDKKKLDFEVDNNLNIKSNNQDSGILSNTPQKIQNNPKGNNLVEKFPQLPYLEQLEAIEQACHSSCLEFKDISSELNEIDIKAIIGESNNFWKDYDKNSNPLKPFKIMNKIKDENKRLLRIKATQKEFKPNYNGYKNSKQTFITPSKNDIESIDCGF